MYGVRIKNSNRTLKLLFSYDGGPGRIRAVAGSHPSLFRTFDVLDRFIAKLVWLLKDEFRENQMSS